jgi:hypothetical protein
MRRKLSPFHHIHETEAARIVVNDPCARREHERYMVVRRIFRTIVMKNAWSICSGRRFDPE